MQGPACLLIVDKFRIEGCREGLVNSTWAESKFKIDLVILGDFKMESIRNSERGVCDAQNAQHASWTPSHVTRHFVPRSVGLLEVAVPCDGPVIVDKTNTFDFSGG